MSQALSLKFPSRGWAFIWCWARVWIFTELLLLSSLSKVLIRNPDCSSLDESCLQSNDGQLSLNKLFLPCMKTISLKYKIAKCFYSCSCSMSNYVKLCEFLRNLIYYYYQVWVKCWFEIRIVLHWIKQWFSTFFSMNAHLPYAETCCLPLLDIPSQQCCHLMILVR